MPTASASPKPTTQRATADRLTPAEKLRERSDRNTLYRVRLTDCETLYVEADSPVGALVKLKRHYLVRHIFRGHDMDRLQVTADAKFAHSGRFPAGTTLYVRAATDPKK